MANTPVALLQLARIYGLDRDTVSEDIARRAIASDPDRLAEALFHEAVESDDVISVETAFHYLEGRFDFLADLLPEDERPVVRRAFSDRVRAWER